MEQQDRVNLRSEAEAPWRLVRLVLFGFSAVSAGVGTLTSIPQVRGSADRDTLPAERVRNGLGQ